MREIRLKEKAVTDVDEMKSILKEARFMTFAMCLNDEPYLVSLSHGYDEDQNAIYFHCASEGKKIDILEKNNVVWGEALVDLGYQQGLCTHLYKTTQIKGRVTFIEDIKEKEHALRVMIEHVDDNPEEVIASQMTPKRVEGVHIGRIDIDYMSCKKADKK
jgi:nitroimidazol reductase NimA-like FMN-containing flavoprotein (pyridoxamine 5'-phosphate oxidase superfamily)